MTAFKCLYWDSLLIWNTKIIIFIILQRNFSVWYRIRIWGLAYQLDYVFKFRKRVIPIWLFQTIKLLLQTVASTIKILNATITLDFQMPNYCSFITILMPSSIHSTLTALPLRLTLFSISSTPTQLVNNTTFYTYSITSH